MNAREMARLVYGSPIGDDEDIEVVDEEDLEDEDDDYEYVESDLPLMAFGDPGRATRIKGMASKALKSKALKKVVGGVRKKKKRVVVRRRRGKRAKKARRYGSRGGVRISQSEVKQIVMLCLHKAIASMAK